MTLVFTPLEMAQKRKKSNVDRQIDESLKRVYDDALNEEIPDKFLELIAKLRASGSEADDDK